MTRITVADGTLDVEIEGLHKHWALKRRVTVPLSHVRSVTPNVARWAPPFRVPGTRVPGVIQAGTFRGPGRREFWDVRHPDKAIAVDLADEHYTRLVLEVDDPQAAITMIEQARQ